MGEHASPREMPPSESVTAGVAGGETRKPDGAGGRDGRRLVALPLVRFAGSQKQDGDFEPKSLLGFIRARIATAGPHQRKF